MKRNNYIFIIIIILFLLVSCSPVHNAPADPTKVNSSEKPAAIIQATATSTVEILPASTNTPEPTLIPTLIPTKTKIVPALNGTPSPKFAVPIDSSNVKDVRVIRRTGSQDSSPQIPGRTWETEFNVPSTNTKYEEVSYLYFSGEGDSVNFLIQDSDGYRGITEKCEWDLLSPPNCDTQKYDVLALPANYQLYILGEDGEEYFLKSRTQLKSLHLGWEKEGKFITQLPTISDYGWGWIYDPKYDPETGIIQVKYPAGHTYIFNRITRSRLLVEGTNDQFVISKDGNDLFNIIISKEKPTLLELVHYDAKTLKEDSRTLLEKSAHTMTGNNSGDYFSPQIISTGLSPDGKNLYAFLLYVNATQTKKVSTAFFLTIPFDEPSYSTMNDLGFESGYASNMIITKNGDMAIVAQANTGDLLFIETASGKILHTLHVGGNPIKLALKPDGKIIAVADVKDGIQLVGIPGE